MVTVRIGAAGRAAGETRSLELLFINLFFDLCDLFQDGLILLPLTEPVTKYNRA
jgi:hypothetical protein